ncbi:hypothetical protein SDC9_90789 [bioreactor metagenome]|uniref:Uncharacterized protein n=1 Tax=bioreactor metagenome TaxID=1076179 RepID=A0A644ZW23_9ZZZZ
MRHELSQSRLMLAVAELNRTHKLVVHCLDLRVGKIGQSGRTPNVKVTNSRQRQCADRFRLVRNRPLCDRVRCRRIVAEQRRPRFLPDNTVDVESGLHLKPLHGLQRIRAIGFSRHRRNMGAIEAKFQQLLLTKKHVLTGRALL